MRVLDSIKTYIIGSFFYGWDLLDRPRVFYYQTKSYLQRFILKNPSANQIVSVKISVKGENVYFRDNWFDPRSVPIVFENDYNRLDKDLFKNCRLFVDIGANIGLVSRSVRLVSPSCKIICFEPRSK